jgi:hypothetical protein
MQFHSSTHSIPITIPIATTAESQNARAQDNLAYAEHQTALELKTLQRVTAEGYEMDGSR